MRTITVGELMVPLGSILLLLYMATFFSKKIKTRDLTPGLQHNRWFPGGNPRAGNRGI